MVTMHHAIRRAVLAETTRQETAQLAQVDRDDEGDTIYAIDNEAESVTHATIRELERSHSFVFAAEGTRDGEYGAGPAASADAEWRIIHDPIDGTRGIMYQKRSAWIL